METNKPNSIMNRNYPKPMYVVWSFCNSGLEINIDGDDLNYCQLGETHHGLQCNLMGDNKNHKIIQDKCKQITELFREIETLNQKQL